MKEIEGYDVKIYTDNIESSAIEQIQQLLSIDVFSDKKIRIMPDVHAGAGCVIGFTGDLGDKVIPNIVGVDIGCGMRVAKLGNMPQIDYHKFNEHILANVPSGMIVREEKFGFPQLVGDEMEIYREAKQLVLQLHCYRELKDSGRIYKSIGTLGGGNHFIELDKDNDGNMYVVVHTGSRNLGKQVADIYQSLAIRHLTEGADELEEKYVKPSMNIKPQAVAANSKVCSVKCEMIARPKNRLCLPDCAISTEKCATTISTTCDCANVGLC